jgi:hypothetical protein
MDSYKLVLVLGFLAASAAGAWAWRRNAPRSFWFCVGFPLRAVWVYLTWSNIASGCKLTRQRTRLRFNLEAVPVAGAASRSATTLMQHKRKMRRVDVERAPRLGLLKPTALGWRVRVKLHDGQIPADYTDVAERLAHAWRVQAVRVLEHKPGKITLVVTRLDPLTEVSGDPVTGDLLTVRPGMLETGDAWVMDFRVMPHWLIAGATQSGKSTLINAVIRGLAPQPVALIGFDLKGGVELTPYAPRLSALATTRKECNEILDDLIGILEDRMTLCRDSGVRNVWKLPDKSPTGPDPGPRRRGRRTLPHGRQVREGRGGQDGYQPAAGRSARPCVRCPPAGVWSAHRL